MAAVTDACYVDQKRTLGCSCSSALTGALSPSSRAADRRSSDVTPAGGASA